MNKGKRLFYLSDLEEEEQLRAYLKIVPDEEEEIDYEVLGMRYPIVNWESAFYHTDRYGVPHDYYRVFRANGSSRYIKTFTEMVSRFDRLDFIELHSLVMQRFSTTTPEGIDLVLWGDLRIMFEETADDDIWKNQEKWIIKSWTFYENYGVHILALEDGTEIHMLAERRYPLIRETLKRMMELRLTTESEGEAVFDLLRFILNRLMSLGAKMGVRRIVECWFFDHTTNGHQFTMSNRHQELASPESNGFCKELASPKKTALGKDISNPLIVGSFLKTIWLSVHHVIAMKHWLFHSKRLWEDCWVLEDFTTYCCWFNIGAAGEGEPLEADKSEIYTLKGEPLDTFLMKDEEIKLNHLKDSDDSIPIPRVSVTPLDSLDSFFDSYDTSYTNPSELDSEYTLNYDNPIFNIQNEHCDEPKTETIMDEVRSTVQIPPLFDELTSKKSMQDIILYQIRHGMVNSSRLSVYLDLFSIEDNFESLSSDSFELGDQNVVFDPGIFFISGVSAAALIISAAYGKFGAPEDVNTAESNSSIKFLLPG
ncbi:hypothetical protein Tco_1337575 [Tanacetum coccineum]